MALSLINDRLPLSGFAASPSLDALHREADDTLGARRRFLGVSDFALRQS